MLSKINMKLAFIFAITILCAYLILPTARYFHKVSTQEMPPDAFAELRDNYPKYFKGDIPKDSFDWKNWEKKLNDAVDAQNKKQDIAPFAEKIGVNDESKEAFKTQINALVLQRDAEAMRDKSLKLGLDLMGGVDILLAIDMEKTENAKLNEIVFNLKRRFSKDSIDAVFTLDAKTKCIKLSIQNKKDLRNSKNILAEKYYQDIFKGFNADALDTGDLQLFLKDEMASRYANESIDGAIKVIRNRVDELKVTQPSVSKQGTNRVRVQLPGEKDPERVISNIIKPATLEFRIVKDDSEAVIAQKYNPDGTLKTGADPDPGYVYRKGIVTKHKENGEVIDEKVGYLVKDKPELTGQYLKNAYVNVSPGDLESPVQVHLEFDAKGAAIFRDVTSRNKQKRLAIVLDNIIYSAPVIEDTIPHGRCFIRGNFMVAEANDLSLVLKAGALPADLEVVEKRSVGAALGVDAIKNSVKALCIGGAAVVVFMIAYYGMAGVVATFAIILNFLIIIAALSLAKATLTLSGIGGILLTMGMAVDANVLIYERIREELDSGKTLKNSISIGFKRAFSVIFDSNLTTILSAMVLLQFASGSIQGFALTMVIGLVANLYTGLTVTHACADYLLKTFGKFGVGAIRIFKNTKVDFMGIKNICLTGSITLIILSIIICGYKGKTLMALDFSGGVITTVKFDKKVDTESLRKAFDNGGLPGSRIQDVANKPEYLVKAKLFENDIQKTQAKIEEILKANFSDNYKEILGTQAVGSEVGQEFIWLAIQVVLLCSLCIGIYLWFRFQWQFGLGAVLALIHDVIITTGCVALSGREISLDVVSALLIIIGYSVNDTIVIFDRIRENEGNVHGLSFRENANRSINETLSRTTITVATVLFTLVALYFFSTGSLNDFAFTLFVGVLYGTYSSIFIATPIADHFNKIKSIAFDKGVKKQGYSATAQKVK